ncbi:jg27645, partial [Pararge aegeria aegeria]
ILTTSLTWYALQSYKLEVPGSVGSIRDMDLIKPPTPNRLARYHLRLHIHLPASEKLNKNKFADLNSVSTLLLTDIHEYLADFGYENKAQYVVSEDALQCLLEWNRPWEIPVTVHRIFELGKYLKLI